MTGKPDSDSCAVLRTSRLTLEPLCEYHAALLIDRLGDKKLYEYIPQNPPTSIDDLRGRYRLLEKRASPDGREAWLNWAVRLGQRGDYIGLQEASVCLSTSRADIAYFVFSPFWRLGYAREACWRVLAHLFDTLNATVVRAVVDSRNKASWGLLESLCFERTDFVEKADFFKGVQSDELTYEMEAARFARERDSNFR